MRCNIAVALLVASVVFLSVGIGNVRADDSDTSMLLERIEKLETQLEQLKAVFDKVNSAYGELKIRYNELLEKTKDMDSGSAPAGKPIPQGVPKGC